MNPDIERMLAELEAIKADGVALCNGRSEAQFNWRPGPDRWSMAECLVHLNVSVPVTLPAFDAAIARATPARSTQPFHYGWLSRWIVRSMEPPPRFRMRTIPRFRVPPTGRHTVETVLADFLTVREQFAERLKRADGLDLAGVRAISPVNRMIRLPLGAYFEFILAHDRRHLWQARQVHPLA